MSFKTIDDEKVEAFVLSHMKPGDEYNAWKLMYAYIYSCSRILSTALSQGRDIPLKNIRDCGCMGQILQCGGFCDTCKMNGLTNEQILRQACPDGSTKEELETILS